MLWYAMICYDMLCYDMLCYAMLCKDDPSYHVHAGSAYTNTQGIADGSRAGELGYNGEGDSAQYGQIVRHVTQASPY